MYIPHKRALSHKDSIIIICVACILFVVASCVCSYFGARWLRQRHYNPKYIPGQFLKEKWKQWRPGSASYGQVPNPRAPNADDTTYHGAGGAPEMTTVNNVNNGNNGNNGGVQRETSVRSIMTLPPYSVSPKESEQVVAREGERAGMDMVVEFPETADEQEARREDQMESLYQLRLQRRQEMAEREARRQERHDARARGDTVRLEQLAAESRARNNARTANASNTSISATAVLAEQQSRERDRRISSVSYASIGHVRHDGSRLRADSHDSDHQPLLSNAVVDSASPSLMDQPSMRSRVQSIASSIMTASTALTEIDPLALRPTSTHRSSRPTSMHFSSRPVSVAQPEEGDLGTLGIPPPPDYEHLRLGQCTRLRKLSPRTRHKFRPPTSRTFPFAFHSHQRGLADRSLPGIPSEYILTSRRAGP
ncbi:uncharacterized protein N7477_001844 [Penicillium maclennaniae]|uniref:uncharacterized protein n=1 Tax=Penicillium maclennaniae TaxID=1343394 RepID=UPI002540B9DD|nr:uncharacterized protein N7477_001844 [Penicillium maclennaniae]KAJ5681904.1 hypothetical protein N7477_001844 [Penicillium maclennaniae]